MDDPLKDYRHETPTSRLRWRGDVLEQKWLIADKDGVSNPAYEWREIERHGDHMRRLDFDADPIDLPEVTRVEVIDKNTRAYVSGIRDKMRVSISFQDDGRTLKVFIEPK